MYFTNALLLISLHILLVNFFLPSVRSVGCVLFSFYIGSHRYMCRHNITCNCGCESLLQSTPYIPWCTFFVLSFVYSLFLVLRCSVCICAFSTFIIFTLLLFISLSSQRLFCFYSISSRCSWSLTFDYHWCLFFLLTKHAECNFALDERQLRFICTYASLFLPIQPQNKYKNHRVTNSLGRINAHIRGTLSLSPSLSTSASSINFLFVLLCLQLANAQILLSAILSKMNILLQKEGHDVVDYYCIKFL